MSLSESRMEFEDAKKVYESAKLKFLGVDGYDVYNPSIPFVWEGRRLIYGRVERRSEWARSWVRLFELSGKDEWALVPGSMLYQLEDPYVSVIHGDFVFGGTHVRCKKSKIDSYYGYFYRGRDLEDLRYFTSGPDKMKDIRLVELKDSRIGVFSRPRGEAIIRKFGCESQIGFTIISSLDELDDQLIENAPYIDGLFEKDEWGACNQAYLLDSGLIGAIGHKCYKHQGEDGVQISSYLNCSFVMDPESREVSNMKIIGTRPCYPAGPAKRPNLVDCAFTSGIVMRSDGKADLYSGIGDAEAGRIAIDYPFEGHGKIVGALGSTPI